MPYVPKTPTTPWQIRRAEWEQTTGAPSAEVPSEETFAAQAYAPIETPDAPAAFNPDAYDSDRVRARVGDAVSGLLGGLASGALAAGGHGGGASWAPRLNQALDQRMSQDQASASRALKDWQSQKAAVGLQNRSLAQGGLEYLSKRRAEKGATEAEQSARKAFLEQFGDQEQAAAYAGSPKTRQLYLKQTGQERLEDVKQGGRLELEDAKFGGRSELLGVKQDFQREMSELDREAAEARARIMSAKNTSRLEQTYQDIDELSESYRKRLAREWENANGEPAPEDYLDERVEAFKLVARQDVGKGLIRFNSLEGKTDQTLASKSRRKDRNALEAEFSSPEFRQKQLAPAKKALRKAGIPEAKVTLNKIEKLTAGLTNQQLTFVSMALGSRGGIEALRRIHGDQAANLAQTITTRLNKYLNEISGAAVNEQEMRRLKAGFSGGYTVEGLRNGLDSMRKSLRANEASILTEFPLADRYLNTPMRYIGVKDGKQMELMITPAAAERHKQMGRTVYPAPDR